MIKKAFAPIVDENSKILILGTMPGERSLQQQQYYGHKGNQFWKLIFTLVDRPLSDNYEEKKQLLLNKGIALWDVLEYCERTSSADSAIKNECPNDFGAFYKNFPGIQNVFFSSGKAAELYTKYIVRDEKLSYHQLPSPSGANTWKTFEEKLAEWKKVLMYL
jgi:hypoxanthine-DNA glycosylase